MYVPRSQMLLITPINHYNKLSKHITNQTAVKQQLPDTTPPYSTRIVLEKLTSAMK